MKTTLFAVALVVALALSSAAQSKVPVVSQHRAGDASVQFQPAGNPAAPPPLCKPCLFYGGDLNTSDSNAAGMSDENTLLIVGGSSTYGAINLPSTATVQGVVFNVQADAAFDPQSASYDIRTGVSEGNGGTSVASGTGHMSVAATGRNFLGLNEYSIAVLIPNGGIVLNPGEYWFNATPNCTDVLDGSCSAFRQFVSNTTQETNALNGGWQPIHEMFLNSSFFGFTWANWCDSSLGFNQNQCAGLSFAVIGHK